MRTWEPGTYVWEGTPKKEDEPLEGEAVPEPPPPESDEKDEADVEGAEKIALPLPGYALPFVRLAQDARALPPGGTLKLTKLERQPFGQVEGELQFRDGSEGDASTAALMGEFSVRLCHISLDSARSTTATE